MAFGDNMGSEIERVHSPSVEEFNNLYANQGKPVLITGVVSNWKAYGLWNPAYFKSVCGDRQVGVRRFTNGAYNKSTAENMRLADYLDVVSQAQTGDERLYLGGQPLNSILPEVCGDYVVPQYVDTDKFQLIAYMGSSVHSQLHFHPFAKALLCVVSGSKRIKIFAPDQTPYLYQTLNFSRIEGEPVDLKKFPLYAKAHYYEIEVKAGEMLFFPIYWWHGVETMDFTSAIVFFWKDNSLTKYFPPRGIPWHTPLAIMADSVMQDFR
jgi:hypothetical protein